MTRLMNAFIRDTLRAVVASQRVIAECMVCMYVSSFYMFVQLGIAAPHGLRHSVVASNIASPTILSRPTKRRPIYP